MPRQWSTIHDPTSFPTWGKDEINVPQAFCSLQSRRQGKIRIGEDRGLYSRAVGGLQEEEDGRITEEDPDIGR